MLYEVITASAVRRYERLGHATGAGATPQAGRSCRTCTHGACGWRQSCGCPCPPRRRRSPGGLRHHQVKPDGCARLYSILNRSCRGGNLAVSLIPQQELSDAASDLHVRTPGRHISSSWARLSFRALDSPCRHPHSAPPDAQRLSVP